MRQANIEDAVSKIEQFMAGRMCQANAEKIRTLEKITWGAVVAAIASIVKSFWHVGS